MIKRDIVETVYEYDKDGHLTRKTVTETHEEDTSIFESTSTNPWNPYTYKSWPNTITCTGSTQDVTERATITNKTI